MFILPGNGHANAPGYRVIFVMPEANRVFEPQKRQAEKVYTILRVGMSQRYAPSATSSKLSPKLFVYTRRAVSPSASNSAPVAPVEAEIWFTA